MVYELVRGNYARWDGRVGYGARLRSTLALACSSVYISWFRKERGFESHSHHFCKIRRHVATPSILLDIFISLVDKH